MRTMLTIAHHELPIILEYIPENMDGWSRLEKLDLTHNFLRALPIDFAILTKDVEVIVSRNPINDLPNKWNENFLLYNLIVKFQA